LARKKSKKDGKTQLPTATQFMATTLAKHKNKRDEDKQHPIQKHTMATTSLDKAVFDMNFPEK